MKLIKLSLRDFRGFRSFDLDLAPDVTALVGVNGAGKTSILDALARLLSCLVEGIQSGEPEEIAPDVRDVRVGASTAYLSMEAEIGDQTVAWSIARTLLGHPPGARGSLAALEMPVRATQASMALGSPLLPLAVFFPTTRGTDVPTWGMVPQLIPPRKRGVLRAYEGALEGGARSFQHFFEWFREEEDIYNEQVVSAEIPASSPLPAVREAIERILPGARKARVERRLQRMTVEINGERLDVAQLSDGERSLLTLAGDLARRMALAAPTLEKPLEQPAVVLLDEIELHLHPGLQRQILPRLRSVFPNAQFIVTTHSPQVLSSLHAANVRVIERFELRMLERGTWRRDTNRILETAFGDPGRPPEVAAKLNALRDAVDAERFDDARRLIAELSAMIEGDDPDVFFYQQMLPPEEAPRAAS
ncbi:MAG TPA: AAA family ATPase [Polyangiaceae bacterium]|jgi:ABC-type cobalamin/Fe3+-siderophores transport system ATPase subunit|nr:AAA family ATPase [Polyangiaceae bacterium]